MIALAAFLGLALTGASACAAAPDGSARAERFMASRAQQITAAPRIDRVVGRVSGLVCDDRYDPAKGQVDVLKQLQAKALQRGGDGVIGLQFIQVTNTRSPCWHGVAATGLAVIYAR